MYVPHVHTLFYQLVWVLQIQVLVKKINQTCDENCNMKKQAKDNPVKVTADDGGKRPSSIYEVT